MFSNNYKEIDEKWMKTTFKKTVKMSTYLLAVVVCDFDFVENFTADAVQVKHSSY